MAYSIVNAKEVAVKAKSHAVEQADAVGNDWNVISGTSGETYTVHVSREEHYGSITVAGARCSCNWGIYRRSTDGFRSACSHVQAVYAHLAQAEDGRTTSAWGSLADARRQHRPMVAIGDGVILTTRAAKNSNGNGREYRPVRKEIMYK